MPKKIRKRQEVTKRLAGIKAPQRSEAKDAPAQERPFPIVGIGASAGGLEALEQFFSSMPADTGMVFVVVQHLDPSGHSSMPEILPRFTKMPVHVAAAGMKVKPNSIYLIPPAKNMGIQDGALYLREPTLPPGLRLPIDFFFRSLAEEERHDAISIIFSGTGTDGTLGLQAIKAEQGTVFVQDPKSARYDGMPRSAINTGLADFVLKPDEMPQQLIRFVEHSAINGGGIGAAAREVREPLQRIFAILRTRTGNDFSGYKLTTVRRRLQRRMSVNQIKDISEYARLLKESEDEVRALQKDLLISVTHFFRDPEAFKALQVELKRSLEIKAEGSAVRVWVAGCATGEEAYSVAIVVAECLDEIGKHMPVQMYGTDIDAVALQVARAGIYPANIATDVTPERIKRHFSKENSAYRIKEEMRERLIFAPHNFIKDPPFSRMDLICCRNLLIYLEGEAQKRLLPLLHYALSPGGILFLGPSETVGEAADLFGVVDRKWKIYRRNEVTASADRLKFPAAFAPSAQETTGEPARAAGRDRIPELAEKIFLDQYAPTFAVIDERYRLVYVRGRTGKYLEIASGQPSLSILKMAREGLKTELTAAISRSASEKKIVHEAVRIKDNGEYQAVNLTVTPLTGPGVPPGFLMVVFQEAGPVIEGAKGGHAVKSRRLAAALEEELKLTRITLQSTIEELEATNEELKSANEELQSNNEELQSTNEELDTSREELQSLNEELTTLNAELQDKNELLTTANDDLRNFLNRTEIAIMLLDEGLAIRSFTPATSEVFNVRDIDVGRPLDEITPRLTYENIAGDAREVLRTMLPREVKVRRRDGHWFNMRILPYLTAHNVVSGVVMSFVDINAAESLRETQDYLENLFNYANTPIIVWNPELKITRFNHAFERLTGRSAEATLGKKIDIFIPSDRWDEVFEKINRITAKGERWEDVEIPVRHVDGSILTILWNSATVFSADGRTPSATIALGQDITERKKMDQLKDVFIGMVSHELRTPLMVVSSAVKTALEEEVSPEDMRELLRLANSGAERLAGTLKNLLELSRHQAGRLTLNKKSVGIAKIIRNALEGISREYPARTAVLEIPARLPPVTVDADRLERILHNLVENAFKYSAKGTEVRIFARREKGNLVIGVADHGVGMSPKEQQQLFEPFNRLASASGISGIGLGLVVCRSLVEAHGGRIWVESRPGVGSTFLFTIPLGKGSRARNRG